ncbi:MAG TPA: hypothetical protein VMX38_00630 [Verrucomicrobiae bacterium]|jgi:hypothetical protein|nr:hypothetical protein [Verrucomicrobiae bacterium]
MKSAAVSKAAGPHITIYVAGKLFQGHLSYLSQLVQSAQECCLWPRLNLARLEELDGAAVSFLSAGENRDFGILYCPHAIRERIEFARVEFAKGDAAAA